MSSSPTTADPPELLHKLEGSTAEVTGLVVLPAVDGVVSSSLDGTVRVWLLRDSGQYWPSVCHDMGAPATCINYRTNTRQGGATLASLTTLLHVH